MTSGGGSDRRAHPRRVVCVAAHLETSGRVEPHFALVRDVSVTGALLLTRTRPKVGEVVDLQLILELPGFPDELTVRSKIIRVQDQEEGQRDVWRYRVALAFEDDLEPHEELIEELAAQLDAAGLAF